MAMTEAPKSEIDKSSPPVSTLLPSPEILAEYEKLVPGSSGVFIKEYLNNESDKIELIKHVEVEKSNFRRFAFAIGTAAIAGLFGTGGLMAIAGHEAAAAIVSLGGTMTAFITAYYAKINDKDQDQLAKDLSLISKIEVGIAGDPQNKKSENL